MSIKELEQDLKKVGKHIRRGNKGEAIELLEKWTDIPTDKGRTKLDWPSERKMREWYHVKKMSLRDIGNKLDRSYQAVKDHFDKVGIETRCQKGG